MRFPDPAANPYLGFTAMLMAGLDGIKNKIHPGDPMDKDLYDLPPEELKEIPTVCGSLREALGAVDADRDFLKAGGVFDDDQIDSYIKLKVGREHALRDDAAPGRVRHVLFGLTASGVGAQVLSQVGERGRRSAEVVGSRAEPDRGRANASAPAYAEKVRGRRPSCKKKRKDHATRVSLPETHTRLRKQLLHLVPTHRGPPVCGDLRRDDRFASIAHMQSPALP